MARHYNTMQKPLNIETATQLLEQNMQNQNLRRHCYAVGKTLSAFHDFYSHNNVSTGNLTKEQWEIVGILHDADWEKTSNDPNQHTLLLLEWLDEYKVPEEMLNVFRSHNNKHTNLREPETLLEWTLECCDELTGFIVAVALVMLSKKLSDVTVERVLSKFKQKEFARAVERSQILQCESKLNILIGKFIEITLDAMQKDHDLLGL